MTDDSRAAADLRRLVALVAETLSHEPARPADRAEPVVASIRFEASSYPGRVPGPLPLEEWIAHERALDQLRIEGPGLDPDGQWRLHTDGYNDSSARPG